MQKKRTLLVFSLGILVFILSIGTYVFIQKSKDQQLIPLDQYESVVKENMKKELEQNK